MARRSTSVVLLVLLMVTGWALSACAGSPATGYNDGRADDGYYGVVLGRQYTPADVELTADDGTPYDLATDPAKPLTLVFFGYTHCPDICPAVLASLASGLTRLDDAQRAQVDVVFVTTDPARDDAKTVRSYLDRFDPTFLGLTGSLADVTKAGDALGVFIEKGTKLPSGGYEVTHGTQVIGLDGTGRAPIVWTQDTSPAQFATDLTQLLDHPLEDS